MNRLDDLKQRRERLRMGGGLPAVNNQHLKGKKTARERLSLLFDNGVYSETGSYVSHRSTDFDMPDKVVPGDGVVCGFGKVHGRNVAAYAQDFTVMGGSMGEEQANKICRLIQTAMDAGMPVVGMNDSGGARIQEGVNALTGYGRIFYMHTRASGVIPQISAILGPCAGGAVYSPALTDFVFVVDQVSRMFITGPDVIRAVTGETVTADDLGGAYVHSAVSGNAHFRDSSEEACIARIRQLLNYLPSHYKLRAPWMENGGGKTQLRAALNRILPEGAGKTYDMHGVIREIVDRGEYLAYMAEYAPNILTVFAHAGGMPVGLIANQPSVQAGCLDAAASDKAARFIRTCDAFGLPLVTLVDVPGFLPGKQQEYAGIIRHGAKMLFAYSEATVPKVTVILRKAYGGAYLAMCCKALGADAVFAWPSAEIAVMGDDGAARILARNISSPEEIERWKEAYRDRFLNPYRAAERGQVDDVIQPAETRARVLETLELLRLKPGAPADKKHGNIPL